MFFAGSALVVGTKARAHDRAPNATQVVVEPGNEAHLVVGTTFGLLSSVNGGTSWQWICEGAVGYDGSVDPPLAIVGSGSVVAGVVDGVSLARNDTCGWDRVGAPIRGNAVVAMATDPLNVKRLAVIALPASGTPDVGAQVSISDDNGRSWKTAGDGLPEGFRPTTLAAAPTTFNRMYTAGPADFPLFGRVMRTDDGARTWNEFTFSLDGGNAVYIVGVDMRDMDTVYARVAHDDGDRLLVSRGAGRLFSEVLRAKGELLGFALSPDGAFVAVGGPVDGVSIAGTTTLAFAQASKTAARCLQWTKSGLFACGTQLTDGFMVGLSIDRGRTFAPIARVDNLTPLECSSDSPAAKLCPDEWAEIAPLIGVTGGDAGDASRVDAGVEGGVKTVEWRAQGAGCQCTYVDAISCMSTGVGRSAALLIAFSLATYARRRTGRRPANVREV